MELPEGERIVLQRMERDLGRRYPGLARDFAAWATSEHPPGRGRPRPDAERPPGRLLHWAGWLLVAFVGLATLTASVVGLAVEGPGCAGPHSAAVELQEPPVPVQLGPIDRCAPADVQ